MMSAPLLTPPTNDQRVVYAGLSWQQFKLVQAGFAESPGVRLGYYNTTIEILMPGRDHEMFSRLIGFLIGLFCLENAIEFEPTGSMTQEKEGEVSAQADESYCFGASKPIPDLAIEVVFTSGGMGKLQRYQALGVPEVWFWEDGVFSLHRLRSDGYEAIDRSEISELATLDMALLSRCVLLAQTSRLEAANEFRKGLLSKLGNDL
ncbi:Uma2 family endonuclease [Nodosilinea sp. LEGE 07298]|uniref:Uma2 family endonuclease n=1 Tax=Nodosilinea sp. LEGE 07298 TaxID=2777970 RepID=UPI00188022AC|nr:Uma2 family endonuclease [Nodosilinea sp. LEGE 07298]MBE9111064.1 Uma2 family endonuclease [Nodosilinea sp. LEGE 07298]